MLGQKIAIYIYFMTSKNGFSTNAVLEFAHKEKNNLFYEVSSGEVLGLIFEHGKTDTFLKDTSICYTPIGFSGARSITTADLTLLINNNPHLAAGFIQSRSLLPNDRLGLGFQELNWGSVLSEFRTNYRIPLTTEISPAAMKKDTRARIKKIQKHEDEQEKQRKQILNMLQALKDPKLGAAERSRRQRQVADQQKIFRNRHIK